MTIPAGFKLSVAQAGIKYAGRTDMALIYAEVPAAASAMFTTNKVKAAPVVIGMKTARKGIARAVIINSGNANACTGEAGLDAVHETIKTLSTALHVPEGQVFVSSTGVIGVPMPVERVRAGIRLLVNDLGKAPLEDAARAIIATDVFPKFLTKTVKIGRKTVTISAMCKGAGMIAPNMATMLAFIMTDVAIDKAALKSSIKDAVELSFNRITVDGDRSTNDTALILASGMAGNEPIVTGTKEHKIFTSAIGEVSYELARLIVKDGEGATKVVEVRVRGAKSDRDAKVGALAIANSLLVKTAVYGRDPNWGRIIAALGYAGIALDEARTTIEIGGVPLYEKGTVTGRVSEAKAMLEGSEVWIGADLALGKGAAKVLTCDLTEKYIHINAEYTT